MSAFPNPFRGPGPGDVTGPWYRRAVPTGLGLAAVGLVVTVVLVFPARSCACERNDLPLLKSELRNLVTAEEEFFAGSARWAGDLALLPRFRPSEGVVVLLDTVTALGFRAAAYFGSAQASQGPDSARGRCVVWVGDTSLTVLSAYEGEPRCERR